MKRSTSITVGGHFDAFIQTQIDTGRYASMSEVVRAGLCLLEQEEIKMDTLRKALADGEQSGFVDDFDPQEFKNKLKRGVLS